MWIVLIIAGILFLWWLIGLILETRSQDGAIQEAANNRGLAVVQDLHNPWVWKAQSAPGVDIRYKQPGMLRVTNSRGESRIIETYGRRWDMK